MRVSITLTRKELEPGYATAGAAGADLRAALDTALVCEPGAMVSVATGVAMSIPPGVEGQIRHRSGLAFRHGISIVNSPGTIDSDFRGEIRIILINHGKEPFVINPGDRIAQIVFSPVLRADFDVRDELDGTVRGGGGFGSTGV
ncbi:MAG: dUTP diphosphatase [Spirochaetales bacterium]|nr:MAG: dUTP diphosphatase [Spirochaetales bacterium]